MSTINGESYLSPNEFANAIHRSKRTVQRMYQSHKIPYIQIKKGSAVMIPESALEPYRHVVSLKEGEQ